MIADEITKPLTLAKGLFFVVEFSATGGVSYGRVGPGWEEQDGDRLQAEFTTSKKVDHIGLLKLSRKIVNAAYNVMERFCSQTPIGYWVDDQTAPKMLAEIAEVKAESVRFNKLSQTLGSRRRSHIDIYSMRVGQESDESAALRLAQTVRERLDSLRQDLADGDLNAYATSWKRAKNLPRLATGIQAESIVLALEAAREGRSALAEAIKAGRKPAVDLTAIESAIWLFTDSVNGSLAQVTDPVLG